MEGIRTELQKGGKTLYPKTVSDIVGREGKDESVEQSLQNLEKFAGGGNLRALFEAAGAVYNEETGLYSLYADEGGLTDLTEEDMLETFVSSMGIYNTNNWDLAFIYRKKIRTNIVATNRHTVGGVGVEREFSLGGFCRNCSSIEVIRVIDRCYPKNISGAFNGCVKLKTVIGIINANFLKNTLQVFRACNKLENIKIGRLTLNIDFPDSPLLSNASILYMIQHSDATKDISITLHPSAFARTVADAEIQAALAEKPLVSLVQAAT